MNEPYDQAALEYFNKVTGPCSLVASIVCGLAVISNYCFANQRKFPNIVLVWVCIADAILAIYITLRFYNGPLQEVFTDQIKPGSYVCRISIYFDLAVQMASSLASIIVAYTLYAAIVLNVDLICFTKLYHKKFIVLIWSFSLIFPLLSFIDFHGPTQGLGYCTLKSAWGSVLMVAPWVIMLIIQFRYIVPVLIYTAQVKYKATGLYTSDGAFTRGQIWLYVRFMGILIDQLVFWLTLQFYDIRNIYNLPTNTLHFKVLGVTPLFLAINGFIVLVGNSSLNKFLASKFSSFHANFTWRKRALSEETLQPV